MDEWKGANRWRQQYVERGRGKRWNFAVKQSRANERCYLIALFGCSVPPVEAEISCLAASVSVLRPHCSNSMGALCY